MTNTFFTDLGYLISAVAFVWGLRLLSSPDTAKRGNRLAGIGMGLAILMSLIQPVVGGEGNYIWITGGILVGGIIGYLAAKRVQMTAMPQMVSIFNGLGGACAVVLALAELFGNDAMNTGELSIALLALLIGGVAFTGSFLAYAKLQGLIWDNTLTLPGHNIINNVLLLAILVLGIILITTVATPTLIIVFTVLTLIYGFSFVIPIGGADMPVVISLLNSFTGLSAAAAGLIYNNTIMLIGGIFVGAAGTILTVLMCQAMNRSLLNVLVGGFGGGASSAKGSSRRSSCERSF